MNAKEICLSRHLTGLVIFVGVSAMITGLTYIVNLPGLTSDAIGSMLPWGWIVLFNGVFTL